jgi:CHAD domain-containing protein
MAAGTTTYQPVVPGLDADGVLAALARSGFTSGPPRPSTLAVLDTFDGRIADAGLRLELIDGRRLVLRGEGEVPAVVTVATQPRVAADVPAGPLRRRLARLLDVRALIRLVEVMSQRTEATKRNHAGKVTAAVTIHRDALVNGAPFAPGLVVEASELTGYEKAADELHRQLAGLGLEPIAGGLADLAATSAGIPLGGYEVPVGVALDARTSAIDGFRAVLANLRDAMVTNWDGTIADIDPEFLHDFRVAVRRSRVVLANAGRVLPEGLRARTREDFAWFGEITGTARDLDVYQLEWPDYTADLDAVATEALVPLREHLGALRERAHAELEHDLRSARAATAIEAWSDWLDRPVDPATLGDRGDEPLAVTVRRRIRRAHRRMIERGRAITPATPAETVHELRKDAKKLRYLIECFGGLYDKSARAAFVSRLKALQDTLGAHQDAEVHATALRTTADDPQRGWSADTLLAIGQLIERLEQRRLARRAELADRFGAFDSKDTAKALEALLASAGREGA